MKEERMGRNNSPARVAERRARSAARAVAQASLYKLPDGGQGRELYGWSLAAVSSESAGTPRWTEMSLYRATDGRYALQSTGRSRVYHARGSGCNAGVTTLAIDLPARARACSKCRPGEQDVYDMEIDLASVHVFATARGVLRYFDEDGEYSGLAQRLLKEAALRDPGLARELDAPVPL
jgi:hypothetical protein